LQFKGIKEGNQKYCKQTLKDAIWRTLLEVANGKRDKADKMLQGILFQTKKALDTAQYYDS